MVQPLLIVENAHNYPYVINQKIIRTFVSPFQMYGRDGHVQNIRFNRREYEHKNTSRM